MPLRRWRTVVLGAVLLTGLYLLRPLYIYASSAPTNVEVKCAREGLPGDPRTVPRPSESGTVKVIRLTDLGDYVDRCEVTDVLYELNWDRARGPDGDFGVVAKPGAESKPKLAVLYIHGWHNDAREDSGDLPAFKKLMARLADSDPKTQMTGVYVSWPANSDIPIWHYLDFWQKKGVADRIAASGSVTNIISAVGSIVSKSKGGGRFITIGHSFGARILMASTLQSTVAATQRAHPGRPNAQYRMIESLSQATIFLNPAFEATYFVPFARFNRQEEEFAEGQKPLLLSIATANDDATNYAFPLGQWFAWSTSPAERTTLGNYEKFWTHRLEESQGSSCVGSTGGEALTERYRSENVCLRRTHGFARNPFMVVRAEPSVLSGHNGIWDEKFSQWLFGYLDELTKQLPSRFSSSTEF